MRAAFVVNPRSANGRTGARLAELEELARGRFSSVEILTTRAVGDGVRLAAEAAARADVVVAVGGDGTADEVVNGLMTTSGPRPAFGVVPAGTGSDLVKTLDIPSDWAAALKVLSDRAPRPMDLMRGAFQGPGGPVVRWGVNVIGLGLAGDVVHRVNTATKVFGGRVTFMVGTLRGALAWPSPEVEVQWEGGADGAGSWTGRLVNAFAANAQFCGGGMWVGRGGKLDDGLFELVIVPEMGLARMIGNMPRLYDGTIERGPGVIRRSVARVSARARGAFTVSADVDGEVAGDLPASVECVPAALRVCMGPSPLG